MNRYDTDGTDWDTYFLSHLSAVLLLMPKPVTVFSIFAKISIFLRKTNFQRTIFQKSSPKEGGGCCAIGGREFLPWDSCCFAVSIWHYILNNLIAIANQLKPGIIMEATPPRAFAVPIGIMIYLVYGCCPSQGQHYYKNG